MKSKLVRFSILNYGFEVSGKRYKLDFSSREVLKKLHPNSTTSDLVGLELEFEADTDHIPNNFDGVANLVFPHLECQTG